MNHSYQAPSSDPIDYEVEDDELHLVDPEASNESIVGFKVILSTFLNAFFTSAFLVYIFQTNFAFDLLSVLLGVCAAITFTANALISVKIFRRIRENSIKYGAPEEFRDYANQVSANEPVIHEKVADGYRTKFKFWPKRSRLDYV